VEQLK